MSLGRKPPKGAIDLRGVPLAPGSREFLRMWASPSGPVTCLIDPSGLGPDPMLFGLALVDAARHGAKAYAAATGVPEAVAMARIWEGVDAERAHPTDLPTQLTGKLN